MGYILLIRGRRRNALGRMVKFEEQPESALGLKQWAMGHSITLPDEIPVSLIESKTRSDPSQCWYQSTVQYSQGRMHILQSYK